MNILDENIFADQRALLQGWRIPVRHVGYDIGRIGMADEDIVPFLHQYPGATFFTSDRDFFQRDLCHPRYCLICLFISRSQTAAFIRRILRHPELRTQAQRLGKVIGVRPEKLHVWRLHAREKLELDWPP